MKLLTCTLDFLNTWQTRFFFFFSLTFCIRGCIGVQMHTLVKISLNKCQSIIVLYTFLFYLFSFWGFLSMAKKENSSRSLCFHLSPALFFMSDLSSRTQKKRSESLTSFKTGLQLGRLFSMSHHHHTVFRKCKTKENCRERRESSLRESVVQFIESFTVIFLPLWSCSWLLKKVT